MCGIAGALWTDERLAIAPATVDKMMEVLSHRGPDERGTFAGDFRSRPPFEDLPGVALGFRRLSVIDIDGGQQPMHNEDKTVWVVCNGEIYNYQSLRNRLEGNGHAFRTNSDIESLVHLYEDEGPDCFRHINGMFAAAIWDSSNHRLVLARDRMGQKPLVYHVEPSRISFASELKSLLQIPGIDRTIDPGAIDEYLTYQYVPHPNSIFKNIKKLAPGHVAVFEKDRLQVRPYWKLDPTSERDWNPADATEELKRLLTDSVQLRMQSDVPLGAFLSGGVDSSLIVALMSKFSDRPIKTFSIGFEHPEYDETSHAKLVAKHLGTDHHEFRVTGDIAELLPQLAHHFDEPFGDSSAVPTWHVAQQAREHVTVALSGDGGDELFAGYQRYRAARLGSRIDAMPPIQWLMGLRIWQALPGVRQKSLLRRAKRFSQSIAQSPSRRYLEWVAIFQESQRGELYQDDFLEQLPGSDPHTFLKSNWSKAESRDVVTTASLTDLATYLPCDLMTKVDITTMAHGLECRQPMLDHRLVEFAASLPIHLKYRWGRGKRILQQAFGDLLPATIWKRKKMGFGAPIAEWFRHSLKDLTRDTLLGDNTKSHQFFRPDTIRNLIADHNSMRFDHSYRLWSLLMFELWLQKWAE
ncbi:MAG: asparagine synthase (glutamine-hydrolyzing) [Pirellulaceae bacterium]|jgi:asparagine synthase (glutamine-hydrolysing)